MHRSPSVVNLQNPLSFAAGDRLLFRDEPLDQLAIDQRDVHRPFRSGHLFEASQLPDQSRETVSFEGFGNWSFHNMSEPKNEPLPPEILKLMDESGHDFVIELKL